eukprot:280299-Chlamydomonas_euryale.AAC.3
MYSNVARLLAGGASKACLTSARPLRPKRGTLRVAASMQAAAGRSGRKQRRAAGRTPPVVRRQLSHVPGHLAASHLLSPSPRRIHRSAELLVPVSAAARHADERSQRL